MTYILIFMIATGYPAPATTTAEFHTKEACMAAASLLQKETEKVFTLRSSILICAAKGAKP